MGFGREHMRARDGRGEVKEEGKHTHIHTQAHKHTSTRAHTHTHTHTHTYTHTHAHTHTHARKGGGRVRVAERPPTPINPPPSDCGALSLEGRNTDNGLCAWMARTARTDMVITCLLSRPRTSLGVSSRWRFW